MRRVLPVVRREYLERVRSKAFIISTLLGPVLVAAVTVLPGMLMAKQRGKRLRVAVVEASGGLRQSVESTLAERRADGQLRFDVRPAGPGSVEEARARLKKQILEGELDGYLYLAPDALETSTAEYYGKNVSNVMDISTLDKAVEDALIGRRLAGAGLDAERVKSLTRRLDLKTIRLSASGEREDRGGTFFLAMVMMMMLYTTVAMWGAAIMNGVIEEKTNRVVEVIVSSVPTSNLFGGKLVGVGAAGLTQFLVWVSFTALLGVYGAAAAGMTQRMPEMPPLLLVSFVLYFVLGFFLYGALYAAVGSAVNTQQEAQSLAFPVMMPLVLAVVFFPAVLNAPDSTLSVVLSLLPPFTPLLMFLRISVLTPPWWQIALSYVLLLATIAVLTWVAARIYRVGILMYGKRPTFPEILRWARTS